MRITRAVFALSIAFLIAFLGCAEVDEPGSPRANVPPETNFVNVPPDSAVIPYLQTLYWYGNDEDGSVVGFEYATPDTTSWIFVETDTTALLIVAADSAEAVAMIDTTLVREIWVRAVDDDDAVDPTPDHRIFTVYTLAPETYISSGLEDNTYFSLPVATPDWPGIRFTFGGLDEDGYIVMYEARQSPPSLPWSETTETYALYQGLTDGDHVFEVRAIDNCSVTDPTPAEVNFKVVQPTLDSSAVLIVDATRTLFTMPIFDTLINKNSTYWNSIGTHLVGESDLVETVDHWDLETQWNLDHSDIEAYGTVIWHNEHINLPAESDLDNHKVLLAEYLSVGGNLILVGPELLLELDQTPGGTTPGTFTHDYLGLSRFTKENNSDFGGAFGQTVAGITFPDLSLSVTKWPFGQFPRVDLVVPLAAGGHTIFGFDDVSPAAPDENLPCGTWYQAETYNSVLLTFPLSLCEEEDLAGRALADLIDNF
ncbi:hypothetical protein AMJ39_02335 [candidate division TA06 bacterium DG_24]|uniref:Fibronectin type-III domain-containing protein n=3 Tax=Bacteria division TA06 TaxID=1156500 RepID=A0A0S8JI80_UNCT6|nr:MAG: hypothetical protein AMJ39_02335 [candidate division TA06 bacterium DG_24]KPK69071.1 MAG: hypothetical protein AMJ82_06555 [candidate division TA06 bacterium SM23_40]KPL09384.1 MAG: hypothetical protein AMJ71_06570 [candidate division TA06 bacterium SM1_40]